ncbi:MAG: pyridoxamine 5'-phosphate oxidase family protein [Bryobacterales bacterium]|nr:pyridoxamine 5'-phosphate oxidase family protein [Bryobacterales bacterium]
MSENPLAERARELAARERVGTLCTLSKRHQGYPFGSVVQYALDDHGNPILLISAMAQHTQNALTNPHASLLVAESIPSGESVVAGRLTLLGDVEPVRHAKEVQALFLARHPDAEQWVNFGDFAFYRLVVNSAYYVGGFGVMGWVPVEDYSSVLPPLIDSL